MGFDPWDAAFVAGPGLRFADEEVAALAGAYADTTVVTPPSPTADGTNGLFGRSPPGHPACHRPFRGDNPPFSSRAPRHGPPTGTHAKTSIVREYPSAEGDPYYPIPTEENDALYRRYAALAARETGVKFVGGRATYRYYNMDQIVGQALASYRKLQVPTPADAAAYADVAVAAR